MENGSYDPQAGYGTGNTVGALYQNTKIETIEYRFLTEAEAQAKVLALNTSATATPTTASYRFLSGISEQGVLIYGQRYVTGVVGISHRAAARYVSPEQGWTVAERKTTYSLAAIYSEYPDADPAVTRVYWKVGDDSVTATPNIAAAIQWQVSNNWRLIEF